VDSEFQFELGVCQWAEQFWPPERRRTKPVIVARQLGTKRRRWDTLVIECNAEGLRQRANFGTKRLDSNLLHVVRNAPASYEWYRDALPEPSYPWRYVRDAVHQAADRGLIKRRRGHGGRIELKRKWTYPEWVERIVAIENKPDLDASAARDLATQLERDIALSLADEVWVATATTDDSVEPVLLTERPQEAGIMTIDSGIRGKDSAAVVWHPSTLDVSAPGTRILEQPTGGKYDASACRFEYVSPAWKATKRLEIAERAYERGWRSYLSSMRPDCRYFELRPEPDVPRPYCSAKACYQTARECAGSCAAFEPEPPMWRQHGWPITGGPGNGIKRLLSEQRERQRPK